MAPSALRQHPAHPAGHRRRLGCPVEPEALAASAERWLAGGGAGDAPLEMAADLARQAAPWPRLFGTAPTDRRYTLLGAGDRGEAWLIWWPPGGRLELHDHGGAPGAFWVADGLLDEVSTVSTATGRRALRHRHVPTGAGIAFDAEYVHGLVNAGGRGATSVHVYSTAGAPLTFYRLDPRLGLVATRTEARSAGTPP